MRTDELDFELPSELIAQSPTARRGESRLLHYRTADRSIAHRTFGDLPSLLRRGDLLVFNDARVLPARFALRKETGGRVEGLCLAEQAPGVWRVLLKNLGPSKPGVSLHFGAAPDVTVRIRERHDEGEYTIELTPPRRATEMLESI